MKYEDYITHLNETLSLINDVSVRANKTVQELMIMVPKGTANKKRRRWLRTVESIERMLGDGMYGIWKEVYGTICLAKKKHNGRELPF